ncbi:hypothetical protein MIMGU_mgv1a023855mg [Erythranthe guttata]|uniref:NAC domain-containing protein n=1 Tax=Erythranthe guttata TaxID=4155 RepID=A0A022R445_ERYGU|nr:hypothetical protein MIMGU_mgv1a023855mg [Erythranthe guttata]
MDSRAWIIDSRGLAKKVKNAGISTANQINDCGANWQCPNCQYLIDNSDTSHEWPGLPAGVKFDPSDVELLEHLAAKCGVGFEGPHMFIDEFIPTLEGDEGICYTHPENLPGAKKDGTSFHFFYRIVNAYASGQRKRRRIEDQERTIKAAHVRWHKTGKTKSVKENGVQKGFKKIMVLYAGSKTGSKPGKCNWVMHQYHLGSDEDEREGEYVDEMEAVDLSGGESLLCNEIIGSYGAFDDLRPNYPQVGGDFTCGIADLENIELDTPPDFQLNDLQFASQDSVFDWLDRL